MEGWRYTLLALFLLQQATGLTEALQDGKLVPLNMAPTAVDDQFLGCRERMLQSLEGSDSLLESELKDSEEFHKAWKGATCTGGIPNGLPFHSRALEVFGTNFNEKFSEAMETNGANESVYRSSFQYKSLHFLLTDALQLLKAEGCKTLFSGSDKLYNTTKGFLVKFGHFLPAVDKKSLAEEDISTRGTLFNILSCTAADVEKYTCNHDFITWIIPPYEEFEVVNIKEGMEYREIELRSKQNISKLNCAFFETFTTTFLPTSTSNPTSLPTSTSTTVGSSAPTADPILLLLLAAALSTALRIGS